MERKAQSRDAHLKKTSKIKASPNLNCPSTIRCKMTRKAQRKSKGGRKIEIRILGEKMQVRNKSKFKLCINKSAIGFDHCKEGDNVLGIKMTRKAQSRDPHLKQIQA